MSTKTWGLLAAGIVVVGAGAAAVAFAAGWDGPGGKGGKGKHGHGHGRAQSAYLIQFDANKDGTITRAEVTAGIDAQFKQADVNADGKLDALEFQKYNDARKAERKARIEAWRAKRQAEGGDTKERPPHDRSARNFDPMKNMDWDRDGFISPEEFASRTRAQAMRADRDGDGNIQVADLQKKRGHGGRHGKGPDAPATTEPAPQ
ncbi:MAG: hypothetical protein JNL06_18770 [Alphaproteobacteria bacterium]|nr:hypothetical protein [Alphaproteobacteria bacterium]